MRKRLIAVMLVAMLAVSLLAGCHDSGSESAVVDVEETDYDPEEAVKDFEFGELNDV